jgi:hypothetical protein
VLNAKLNTEVIRLDIDPGRIIQDPENVRLLLALNRFADQLDRLGYHAKAFSDSALRKLPNLSIERRRKITASFETWSEWIEPLNPRSDYDNEILLLRRALKKFGLEASSRFWKTIEKGQVVEFYGENMIQLYRSFNFFSLTGYSLLDMSVFEWYCLWHRPKAVLESIASELNGALATYIPVARFKTPRHIIKEIHNASNAEPFIPRANQAEFLYLGSLRSTDPATDPRKGFICSSHGELVALGKEASVIQFI